MTDKYWPKIQQGKFQDEPRPGRDWVMASMEDPCIRSCYGCYVAGQLTWAEMLFEIAFHQTNRYKFACDLAVDYMVKAGPKEEQCQETSGSQVTSTLDTQTS